MKRYITCANDSRKSKKQLAWETDLVDSFLNKLFKNFIKDVNSRFGRKVLIRFDKSEMMEFDNYETGSPGWARIHTYANRDQYYHPNWNVVDYEVLWNHGKFLNVNITFDPDRARINFIIGIVRGDIDMSKPIDECVNLEYNKCVDTFVKNFDKVNNKVTKEIEKEMGTSSVNRSFLPSKTEVKEDFLSLIEDLFEDMGGNISKLKIAVDGNYEETMSHGYPAYVYQVNCTYNGKTTTCNEVYLDTQDEYIPEEEMYDISDEIGFMVEDILG